MGLIILRIFSLNIGIQVADDIVKERKTNGDYKSLTDFCERNCASGAANKTTIENFAFSNNKRVLEICKHCNFRKV